ncbi:MAG: hypothetical protein ACI976_000171 [Aureispira sp.]
MRTLLLLFLLVSLANIGFAQDGRINYIQGNQEYHQFEVGEKRYLLADKVNIRAEASSKSAVVTNLPIGTAVKIIEISDKKLRLNGFKTNWYKVSFSANNVNDKVTKGYVWGGLIAEGTIAAATDPKLLFLYGIASVKKENKEEKISGKGFIQLRACKENKELSKIRITSASEYLELDHWLVNYGNKGLETIQDIIEFGESAPYCGGVNAYNIVFWDGKKLLKATTLYPGGEGRYYTRDALIFPSEKGGVKGKIIGDQEVGWFDDEKDTNVVESHKQVEYTWTGETLKQTKVLIDKEYDVAEKN